jgi:hypothetical protein
MAFKIFMVASADDPVVLRAQASVKTLWRSMRNFRFRCGNKCKAASCSGRRPSRVAKQSGALADRPTALLPNTALLPDGV